MKFGLFSATMGAVGLAASLVAAAPANAQSSAPHVVQIGAMSLDQALHTLAYQFGIQLLYAEEDVGGVQVKPLRGAYTAEQAIRRLLRGTSLVVEMRSADTAVIRHVAAPNPRVVRAAFAQVAETAPSPPPAPPPPPQQAAGNALQEVVVTARRTGENLQTVPVAVSVVTQKTFNAKGVFTPEDLAETVPGLATAAINGNRSNVVFSIRGQNLAFGTLFPAVITYFNEIPVTQISPGSFFDLSNVQVLRGPQGVLFGRVTDGGNVMVTPAHPVNRVDGYVGVKIGDYGLTSFSGMLNAPIVSDKLMARGAFQIDRRDGFTTNLYNGQKLDNVASEAFRFGLTFRPVRGFENYTVVSYQHTHDNGTAAIVSAINPGVPDPITGKVGGVVGTVTGTFGLFPGAYGLNANGDVVPFRPGLTPLTVPNYLANLQGMVARQAGLGPRQIFQTGPSFDRRDNLYVVNTSTADLTPDIQFKNIFGYVRVTEYQAAAAYGPAGEYQLGCNSACSLFAGSGANLPRVSQQQFSDEVRIAGKSFNHRLSWSVGAYDDYQRPGEPFENDTISVGILHRTVVNYVTTREKAGSGWAEYDASDFAPGLKFNGGIRYTNDTVSSVQANYVSPIASALAQSALLSVLLARGTPPAAAAANASATVNTPIPFGQCVSFLGGSFPSNCIHYAASFDAVTWQAGASYQLPSGQMFYVKGSRGYRPGGVNGTATTPGLSLYQPEKDQSVEIGFKGDFHIQDWRIRTDIALYHDNYANIQKNVKVPGPGGIPASIITNAANAVIQGAELELTVQPVRNLTLDFHYAYTDAHFTGPNIYAGQAVDPCNPKAQAILGFCPANRLAYTPRNQVGVSAEYKLPLDEAIGSVTIGADYYYQSSFAETDSSALNPEAIQPGYGLLNLNASWTQVFGKPFDISFFMTNVTNALYAQAMDDLLQNSSIGVNAIVYGPPRMFGFGLKYRFGAGAGG